VSRIGDAGAAAVWRGRGRVDVIFVKLKCGVFVNVIRRVFVTDRGDIILVIGVVIGVRVGIDVRVG